MRIIFSIYVWEERFSLKQKLEQLKQDSRTFKTTNENY